MQIKICGLSTRETIDVSIEAGASHIGLVHHASSPRHLSLERASELRGYCRDRARAVLLLANADIETTGKAIAAVKPISSSSTAARPPNGSRWCARS